MSGDKGRGNGDKPHKYLENEKGDLMDVLGLNLLPASYREVQVYPVLEAHDDEQCAEPEMAREARRYASLAVLSPDQLPLEDRPSRVAAMGYYSRSGALVCFCCAFHYPRHRNGCRASELSLPFSEGVGCPQPLPPTLQQLTSSGRVRIRRVTAHPPVDADPTAGADEDFSLDVYHELCRDRTGDDHDVHSLSSANRTVTTEGAPVLPSHGAAAATSTAPQAHAPDERAATQVSVGPPSSHTAAPLSVESAIRPPRGSDRVVHRTSASREPRPRSYAGPLQQQMCKVCYQQPVMTRFQPCGHQLCCLQCALWFGTCPFCNRRIEHTHFYDRP